MRTIQAGLKIALFLPLITGGASAARVTELTLRWNELAAATASQKVTVALTTGVRVKGNILEVGQDTLRMAIQASSDQAAFPPGEHAIPRKSVGEIRIKRIAGPGRLIGAGGIGAAASLGSLKWAISDSRVNVSDSRRVGQWVAITAGGVAGGYLVGRLIDSKETVIRIDPAK